MNNIAKGQGVISQLADLESDYCLAFQVPQTASAVNDAAKSVLGNTTLVSVVGASFSGAKSLDVSVPENKPVLQDTTVANVKFVEMKLLDSNGKEIKDITVPVAVTIPVPEGINAQKAVIIHVVNDSTQVPIDPIYNAANNTLTFTLDSFSPIAIGEKTTTSAGGEGGQESGSESVSSAYDDGALIALIQNAADGSVITITKEDGINTLSNSFMRELAAKKTVSLSMTYVYNDVEYSILIPAGADIDLEIEWYGPLYLAQHFGNTTAANGQYTIVKGDTLSKIAVRNGLKLSALIELNKSLAAQKYIFPGQTVILK
jgi:nucleoid-associated protein YgaU